MAAPWVELWDDSKAVSTAGTMVESSVALMAGQLGVPKVAH